MKITLDLSRLVAEGKLTPDEAARLKALASQETGSLGINVLVGFGVLAVALGAGALVPTPATALVLGLIVFAIGYAILMKHIAQWELLGRICAVLGALMFAGGVIALGEGSLASMLAATVVLALAAVAARSSLLTALAVLALSACLGARTGYSHAMYSLAIFEPTLTVLLFSALAAVTYRLSFGLHHDNERIALMAARTSVLLVNVGFWVGSLWGDPLMLLRGRNPDEAFSLDPVVPAAVFSIVWALALVAAGVWAVKVNRRWLVNAAAVFGAIHFYTQWFEKLGATPASVLAGGAMMLAIAFALWTFNRRAVSPAAPA